MTYLLIFYDCIRISEHVIVILTVPLTVANGGIGLSAGVTAVPNVLTGYEYGY